MAAPIWRLQLNDYSLIFKLYFRNCLAIVDLQSTVVKPTWRIQYGRRIFKSVAKEDSSFGCFSRRRLEILDYEPQEIIFFTISNTVIVCND